MGQIPVLSVPAAWGAAARPALSHPRARLQAATWVSQLKPQNESTKTTQLGSLDSSV